MKEKQIIGLIQLTKRRNKTSTIITNKGKVPFIEWLLLEKIRIEKDPTRRSEIIDGNKRGYLKDTTALYVNRQEDCSCSFCKSAR